MRLVESERRKSDRDGDIPWDFEPRLERGLQTKPKKRMERRTIFEDGIVVLALDL